MPNALCHFGISYLKEVWPIKYFTHRLVQSFINGGKMQQSVEKLSSGTKRNMFEKIIDSVDKMSASKYTVTSGLLAAGCIKNIFWGED